VVKGSMDPSLTLPDHGVDFHQTLLPESVPIHELSSLVLTRCCLNQDLKSNKYITCKELKFRPVKWSKDLPNHRQDFIDRHTSGSRSTVAEDSSLPDVIVHQ